MSEQSSKGRVRVSELIAHLQTLNPNFCLFSPGYEGGYHDLVLTTVEVIMKLDVNSAWYYGPHEIVDSGEVVGVNNNIAIGYVI